MPRAITISESSIFLARPIQSPHRVPSASASASKRGKRKRSGAVRRGGDTFTDFIDSDVDDDVRVFEEIGNADGSLYRLSSFDYNADGSGEMVAYGIDFNEGVTCLIRGSRAAMRELLRNQTSPSMVMLYAVYLFEAKNSSRDAAPWVGDDWPRWLPLELNTEEDEMGADLSQSALQLEVAFIKRK